MTSSLPYKRKGIFFILLFSFTGFFLSITQVLGESPDYVNYDIFFDLLRFDGIQTIYTSKFEPGFTIIAFALTTLFSSNLLVYSVIVAGAMFLKGVAIYLFSSARSIFFFVAVFYFARYYPLHELTQIRVACGTAFLLVAAIFLWRGNLLYALFACVAALCFHASTLVVIPILFFKTPKRGYIILIGLWAFVLVIVGQEFVFSYIASFASIFNYNQGVGYGDVSPNPLSAVLLLDWAMIAFSLIFWNRLTIMMKRVVLLEIFGMLIFYGSLDFPVVAHRFREIISVFWVFFVVDGLRLKTLIIPTAGFAMASIGLYSYLFIFSGKFFA